MVKALLADFDLPMKVYLVGEPSNAYDKYAVKVIVKHGEEEYHIGYVPKPINVDIWSLRDAGLKPNALITEYNPEAKTYEMFKVQVTFTHP